MMRLNPKKPAIAVLLIAAFAMMPGCTNAPEPTGQDDVKYRAVRADPLRDTQAARQANAQGLAHLDAGELYQAELAFKRSLDADVKFGPAHNHLGKIYFLKRDFYNAAHEFDYAIKLMPRQAAPHNNLGLALLEGDDLDQAIDHFRKAVHLDPITIDFQANLARSLVQRGDRTQEVITLLRNVAVRDERTPWRVWASHELGLMGLD